jgi:hypothetical protein
MMSSLHVTSIANDEDVFFRPTNKRGYLAQSYDLGLVVHQSIPSAGSCRHGARRRPAVLGTPRVRS